MIRGGLRTRFIVDSLRIVIVAGLEELGWFDPTIHDKPPGLRQHRPLRYIAAPTRWDVPIAPNCVAISTEDIDDSDRGLGGEVEDELHIYVDVFCETDQVGRHLCGDIRDIIAGRMSVLGRTGPVVDVYDLRLATPAPFTQVDVEDIIVDRARNESREFENHWFMIRVDLSDEYADEAGATHPTTVWSDAFAPSWERIQAAEVPG